MVLHERISLNYVQKEMDLTYKALAYPFLPPLSSLLFSLSVLACIPGSKAERDFRLAYTQSDAGTRRSAARALRTGARLTLGCIFCR
jgi:hypothetical protein